MVAYHDDRKVLVKFMECVFMEYKNVYWSFLYGTHIVLVESKGSGKSLLQKSTDFDIFEHDYILGKVTSTE